MISIAIQKTNNKGWDNLKQYFKTLTKDYVEVGYFADQGVYPSKKNTKKWSFAQLMAYHELQCDENLVPLRPVFGSITKTQMRGFTKVSAKMFRNQLRGTYYHGLSEANSPKALYKLYAVQIGGMIRERFGSRSLARNEKSTIKRKGSALPMIDTGLLMNSLSYRISRQPKSTRLYGGVQ